MTFLLAFWKPIAAVVAVIAVLGIVMVAKSSYDNGKRDEGRSEIQALWDEDKAVARAAISAQESAWKQERDAREKAEQERDSERRKRSEMARVAARKLPPAVARISVPADVRRVFNDSIDAANNSAASTGPASKPAKDTPSAAEGATSLGLLTEWGVQCVALYDEAKGMVIGWQQFYRGLQTN